MFVGRTAELKALEEIYTSNRSNLVILYGRAGIGKTAIIAQFMKELRAYYYLARECTEREQLLLMEEELKINFPGHIIEGSESSISSYYELLKQILLNSKTETDKKHLIIIDEFHFAEQNSSEFTEAISTIMNDKEQFGNTMFLFCTSSVNWVENGMVKDLGLMARQISGFMKVKELSFLELGEWFPKLSVLECICVNAVLGGVPKYLCLWEDRKSVHDNIKHLFLQQISPLYSEAETFLKSELRELSAYNAILKALAAGNYKLNDIYARTGFSRAKISVYLKNLIQMDIVEKIFSMDANSHVNVQKGLYRIKDNLLNFWYRFVFPNQSMIAIGRGDWVYKTCIEPYFNEYMSESFVELCNEYLKLLVRYKRAKADYTTWGSWNGKEGRLDVIAAAEDGKTLFCGCIWKEDKLNEDMIKQYFDLILLANLKPTELYIFSKGGFVSETKEKYNKSDLVKLIDLKDL